MGTAGAGAQGDVAPVALGGSAGDHQGAVRRIAGHLDEAIDRGTLRLRQHRCRHGAISTFSVSGAIVMVRVRDSGGRTMVLSGTSR
jgi:hypothetical protein